MKKYLIIKKCCGKSYKHFLYTNLGKPYKLDGNVYTGDTYANIVVSTHIHIYSIYICGIGSIGVFQPYCAIQRRRKNLFENKPGKQETPAHTQTA